VVELEPVVAAVGAAPAAVALVVVAVEALGGQEGGLPWESGSGVPAIEPLYPSQDPW
jgi:hypothetical protein